MGYQLLTGPKAEPISLAEAKQHLRVDDSFDDSLLAAMIVAARQQAEGVTHRSMIDQTWRYTFDSFPGAQLSAAGVVWGEEYSTPDNALVLEHGPVTSIVSVGYLDMGGVQQVMPATDYVADLSGDFGRITPVFGKIWPIPMPQIGSCSVVFQAGAADATQVPQAIKAWMLLRIAAMYENREEIVVGRGVTANPLAFAEYLLDPYKVVL